MSAARETFSVQNDSIIVWESPSAPLGGVSVERWYPGWNLRCSPWDNVFVWNNAGNIVPPTVERDYSHWTIRCSPWEAVFVWNDAGAAASVTPTPPTPPPVVPEQFSGGYLPHGGKRKRRSKEELERARELFGIRSRHAAETIIEVAARQAERNELDAQKQFDELRRELLLRGLKWNARYMEALAKYRETFVQEAMDEEDLLALLTMMAKLI